MKVIFHIDTTNNESQWENYVCSSHRIIPSVLLSWVVSLNEFKLLRAPRHANSRGHVRGQNRHCNCGCVKNTPIPANHINHKNTPIPAKHTLDENVCVLPAGPDLSISYDFGWEIKSDSLFDAEMYTFCEILLIKYLKWFE